MYIEFYLLPNENKVFHHSIKSFPKYGCFKI